MAYVEKYAEHEYSDGETVYNAQHVEHREAEASFDITQFSSREDFQKIINKLDLEYRRVETKDGYLYTWSNENLMILTGNNPISGVYRYPNDKEKQTGYASFITVQGTTEAVNQAVELIKQKAQQINGYVPGQRAYI